MKFQGAIKFIGDAVAGISKSGNTWKKKEFVVEEMSGQYPDSAVFAIFGDRCALLDQFKVGSLVEVSFDLRARQFQRKDGTAGWDNSLTAFSIVPLQAAPNPVMVTGQPQVAYQPQQPVYVGMPQQPQPQYPDPGQNLPY